jgi:metal-responsive CopG/Arc/MetJ family transcriptional regulator
MKRRTKNKKIEVRIDDTMLEQLKRVTHEVGTGMSDFVRDAVIQRIEEETDKQRKDQKAK